MKRQASTKAGSLRPATLALIACCLVTAAGALAGAVPASAHHAISSFDDPRDDMANRPGQLVHSRYGQNGGGPFHIPAASGGAPGEIHNMVVNITPPCTNCGITDMVPQLVDASTGNPVGLSSGLVLHHFVMSNPERPDVNCGASENFFGSGNEMTHVHLPAPYGYPNSSPSWPMIVHLVNLRGTPSAGRDVWIDVTWRHRPANRTEPVKALWLDVASCAAEYSAPVGYSDKHLSWTSTLTGRIVSLFGHVHDIEYDDPACAIHCTEMGGALSLTAELVGGPSSEYFGPSGEPAHPGLTGSTLCKSKAYYGTQFGAGAGHAGHLDTVSLCGIFRDIPPGAQAEAYPRSPDPHQGGEYPALGYPLQAGQVIKLHSEYQNDTGAPRDDVMGIMFGYVALRPQQYAEALKVSLVPAFRETISQAQCQARGGAVSQHGAPLSFDACNPPAVTPGSVAHVGTQGNGSASVTAIPGDPATTGTDEADVSIAATTSDIRNGSATGVDYNPSAGADATLITKWRLTDSYNGPSLGDRATVVDFDFGFPVDCVVTADGSIGSTCSVDTSADAVNPGAVKEGKAMSIQLFRVRLNDAGANGNRGDSDDRMFQTQGIYSP